MAKVAKAASKQALQQRRKGELQRRFLEEYAKVGNILLAARQVKIDRDKHYVWLENDPEYEAKFARAHEAACDVLEAEAHRRAVVGVNEPVWYQGKRAGLVKRFSDTLLIFLMKGAMPDKYAQFIRADIQHKGVISRGPDLSVLSNEQFEYLKALAGYSQGTTTLTALAGPQGDSSGGAETGEEPDSGLLPDDRPNP